MKRKTMLLFGGSGLLGSRIRELLFKQYAIVSPTREQVDLQDVNAVKKYLYKVESDIIVYAAGETNVDIAEKQKKYALQINANAISSIAKQAKIDKIPVIYFSTDAVFKGDQQSRPYLEDDIVSPVNYYGLTKAKGEEAVLSSSSKNLVIRLITLYTSHYADKLDFARNIIAKISENKKCYGIVDQMFNPMFSNDAVYGLSSCIEKKISGIIHLGAKDYMTNYQFAKLLVKKFGYNEEKISQVTLADFFKGKNASRAKYTWLDTTKAQKILSRSLLHTNRENIDTFYEEMSALFSKK